MGTAFLSKGLRFLYQVAALLYLKILVLKRSWTLESLRGV